ncbi:hypothetical protein [uncultured Mycobacterium sp.]|uniref:hypothetical protein n=1 Tax=uncultured Mycobacterium sp. TaxID=171292 RepID=UPI0035CA1F2C
MAGRFDVSTRLAEGRAAAEHTQSYVWACHVLGYQHPDLTARGSQVLDWYDSEDGLDLFALDDDCANLWAAVHPIEEALALQRAQLAYLAAAWNGAGADTAVESLQQHCDSGNAVVAAIRAAAEGCAALRDNLWQMVDAKVAAAIDIDDRRITERTAWLSAAQLVTTGAGEQSAAHELVERQVKPHVDNDIRTDWLTAMRSTMASVDASYDTVTGALTAAPAVCFHTPAALTDRPLLDELIVPMASAPIEPAAAIAPPAPADTMPAAAIAPPLPPTSPSLPTDLLDGLPPVPSMSALDAPLADPAGLSSGAGDLGGLGGGGGVGGLGGGGGIGGLVGLAGQIVDAIGGLVGSLTDGLAGPSGLEDGLAGDDPLGDELDADDPVADADDTDDDKTDDEDTDEAAAAPDPDSDQQETGTDTDQGADDSTPEPANPPPPQDAADPPPGQDNAASPAEEPAGAPTPAEPAPPSPPPEGSTPCEIAADALPQAGQ